MSLILEGFDEVKELFAAAPERMRKNGRKAVEVTARRMKDDMRSRAERIAGRHAAAYPASITYDITPPADTVRAEIGPDKERRQGALGNLLEGGGPHSNPHPHVTPGFEANKDDLEVGLGKAIEDSLW